MLNAYDNNDVAVAIAAAASDDGDGTDDVDYDGPSADFDAYIVDGKVDV
jgi:hypothetical protein